MSALLLLCCLLDVAGSVIAGLASAAGDQLPHAVFINLEHRLDRRASIETQLKVIGFPESRATRLSATKDVNGLLGCFDSHRRALELALESGWESALILEDDAVFRDLRSTRAQLLALARWDRATRNATHRAWDVILVSGIRREVVEEEQVDGAAGPAPWALSLRQALRYQTTAGYIVARHYLPAMLDNVREALALLRQHPALHETYSWDQWWKRLQRAGRWFHFDPMLADQAAGKSDITGLHADYASSYRSYELLRSELHAGNRDISFQLEWQSNSYLGVPYAGGSGGDVARQQRDDTGEAAAKDEADGLS